MIAVQQGAKSWDFTVERILIFILLMLLLPGLAIAPQDLFPVPEQVDFLAYYRAALSLNQRASPYDLHLGPEMAGRADNRRVHFRYIYPPFLAAVLRPLALLPLSSARAVWFGMNLAWLLLAFLLLGKILGKPRRVAVLCFVFAIFIPPVHHTLELGQVNTLLFFLITVTIASLIKVSPRWRDEVLSGATLGLAAAIKVYPCALGALLILRRRWAAFLAMLGTVGLALSVGLAVGGGMEALKNWAIHVLPSLTRQNTSPNNQSLKAALGRLTSPTAVSLFVQNSRPQMIIIEPLRDDPRLSRIAEGFNSIGTICLGATLLIGLLRFKRKNTAVEQWLIQASSVITTLLIAMPVVWYHYYVLLLFPLALLLTDCTRSSIFRRLILAGCTLIALQRYWRLIAYAGTSLLLSFGLIGTLLIWAGCMYLLIRKPPDREEEMKEMVCM